MSPKQKILALYAGVLVISAGIIGTGMWLRSRLPKPEAPLVQNVGKEETKVFFQIENDLAGLNQAGEQVKLSDLKGKVWVVAEFFAVCPHCAQRNGAELRALYDQFKGNPDFQIVCVSVDPKMDTVERLKEYAGALGADPKNWWFVNAGDEQATHQYLEKTLKFFGIRERKDPAEVEMNGRFSHDLAFMLVDREWNVVGKYAIADARSEEMRKLRPGYYEFLKSELESRITEELAKKKSPEK